MNAQIESNCLNLISVLLGNLMCLSYVRSIVSDCCAILNFLSACIVVLFTLVGQ